MTTQDCEQNCVLIDNFGRAEKALMRIGFYGSIIVGAYAIYSASLPWGLLYTGLAAQEPRSPGHLLGTVPPGSRPAGPIRL